MATRIRNDSAGTVSDALRPDPDALQDPSRAVERARERIAAAALTESPGGRVGLELEFHLVDLQRPERRPSWDEVLEVAAGVPPLPYASTVTLEPGGQIELSTPPQDDLVTSIAALRADRALLSTALAAAGFGAASLGTDPARPAARVNPSTRYVAMEQHFGALGCAGPGLSMMTATAALQVNLDAGPAQGWAERLHLINDLGPVLVAASAASPLLGGRESGWHSMRQQIWHGIDHSRSEAVTGADPALGWADYALDAPVMLVRDGEHATAVTERVPLRRWLSGEVELGRRPTADDLDYHLTTLFPPVRPRGYLEIRCIDALPDQWWPAVAALTTTLLDDPVAADRVREIVPSVAGRWQPAAQVGLADPPLRAALDACVEVALERCPQAVRPDLEALAELYASGRTPSDVLRERARNSGPLSLLADEAREGHLS